MVPVMSIVIPLCVLTTSVSHPTLLLHFIYHVSIVYIILVSCTLDPADMISSHCVLYIVYGCDDKKDLHELWYSWLRSLGQELWSKLV